MTRNIWIFSSVALALIVLGLRPGAAQQRPMYTQYMSNMGALNPAYAGTRGMLNIIALERKQWFGMEGSPESQTFAINTPITDKGLGLGLSFENDKIGKINDMSGFVDISYRFQVTKTLMLSMGVKAGGNWYTNNLTEIFLIEQNDPAFGQDISRRFAPNVGAGLYLYSQKFYWGLSVPRMLKNDISLDQVTTAQAGKEDRHYYMIGGYAYELNRNWIIKPTLLAKWVDGSPLSFDITGSALYNERLWLSATYRIGDAAGAIVQYRIIDQLWLGYSYDFSLNKLMSFNSGTHEIMLSYDFKFSRYKVKSPRYF